jgi:hypothetical protein
VLKANVHPSAVLMTDEYSAYTKPGKEFARHETVNHAAKEAQQACSQPI